MRSAGGLVAGLGSWLRNSPAAEESRRSLADAVFLPGGDWSELFGRSESVRLMQKNVVLEVGSTNAHMWRVKKGAVAAMSREGFVVGTLGEGQVQANKQKSIAFFAIIFLFFFEKRFLASWQRFSQPALRLSTRWLLCLPCASCKSFLSRLRPVH